MPKPMTCRYNQQNFDPKYLKNLVRKNHKAWHGVLFHKYYKHIRFHISLLYKPYHLP